MSTLHGLINIASQLTAQCGELETNEEDARKTRQSAELIARKAWDDVYANLMELHSACREQDAYRSSKLGFMLKGEHEKNLRNARSAKT